jgi:hypothetical protein
MTLVKISCYTNFNEKRDNYMENCIFVRINDKIKFCY